MTDGERDRQIRGGMQRRRWRSEAITDPPARCDEGQIWGGSAKFPRTPRCRSAPMTPCQPIFSGRQCMRILAVVGLALTC